MGKGFGGKNRKKLRKTLKSTKISINFGIVSIWRIFTNNNDKT